MKTLLMFGTLVALAASPAFAQDSMEDTKDEIKTEMTGDAIVVTPETVVLDAPAEAIVAEDVAVEDVAVEDVRVEDAPLDDMKPDSVTRIDVACPEGTTAQDDGTCMITGDFDAGNAVTEDADMDG